MLSNVRGSWFAYYLWCREALRSFFGGNQATPPEPVRPTVDMSPDAVVLNEDGNNFLCDLAEDMVDNGVRTISVTVKHRPRWSKKRLAHKLLIQVTEDTGT